VSEVQLGERTMLGTLFEFVDGEYVDHSRASDAHLMGVELATLHDTLDRLPRCDIPLVPALSVMNFGRPTDELQLLHGDFSDQNLRNQGGRLRIFDFDDCGYGPRAFDVANSLYMVLFDEMVDGSDGLDSYGQFEVAFLAGYRSGAGSDSVDSDDLLRFVDLRVSALQAWLDDLASAPPGIRTSTPQWHATLRRFIERYMQRRE
ncbi:MAG: phosphotransferase, partial [Actinomycetia bacterium]|nr:phosphotransferase [Actinomycetes bacterium]